jgi:IS5 family transposase
MALIQPRNFSAPCSPILINLWFRRGDANNAVLAAAAYNFRRLIHWLRLLLRQILAAFFAELLINPA